MVNMNRGHDFKHFAKEQAEHLTAHGDAASKCLNNTHYFYVLNHARRVSIKRKSQKLITQKTKAASEALRSGLIRTEDAEAKQAFSHKVHLDVGLLQLRRQQALLSAGSKSRIAHQWSSRPG